MLKIVLDLEKVLCDLGEKALLNSLLIGLLPGLRDKYLN
jgi:hypothetical protein